MALLKKCNLCSEKGLFLKLTNGICDSCKSNLEKLENDYTSILQKIALSPNDKSSVISDLNMLMSKAKTFDGIPSSLSIENCKSLLKSISENEDKVKPSIPKVVTLENLNITKNIETNIEVVPVQPTLTNISADEPVQHPNPLENILPVSPLPLVQTASAIKLNIKPTNQIKLKLAPTPATISVTENIEEAEKVTYSIPITKIRNLIQPLNEKENLNDVIDISVDKKNNGGLTLKLGNTTTLKKQPTTLNLNLQSNNNKKELISRIENDLNSNFSNTILAETQSIKDTFIINNLKKKCSLLISKLDSPNATLDDIAENYFHIKKELLPILNENSLTEIDGVNIKTSLDNAKNTLCIRSKKKEHELFDFFNYISIFVQTTGLAPKNSDIIEISATKISYGKIISEFYTLVNPIKSIKLAVTSVTGITNSDIENQPTIDMLLPSLMDFIDDYQLVSFNSKSVDLFINSNLKKLGMPLIKKPIISSMSLYRIRFKNFHGVPPTISDISSTCLDLLPASDVEYIDAFNSFSLSNSHAIYKLYEVLKYRYK